MKQKTRDVVKNDENRNLKIQVSAMREVCHFDNCAISIAPSILENKLKKIWDPIKSFTSLGASFTFGVTLLAVLLTADFKSMGFSGDTWRAFFLVLMVFSALFFIGDLVLLVWKWRVGNLVTVEKFVEKLKKDNNE
jgi:cytochrome bd-type quinol oxidase subunit 2